MFMSNLESRRRDQLFLVDIDRGMRSQPVESVERLATRLQTAGPRVVLVGSPRGR